MSDIVTRRTRALPSRAFSPPLGPRLRGVLAAAHAQRPFAPTAPRDAASRVAEAVAQLGLEATLYRGALDVGAAEIDHVWAVVLGRVVDPSLPLLAPGFVEHVRAFVAGEIDELTLERTAHPYSVRWRVVGAYPSPCRYVGTPLWGSS